MPDIQAQVEITEQGPAPDGSAIPFVGVHSYVYRTTRRVTHVAATTTTVGASVGAPAGGGTGTPVGGGTGEPVEVYSYIAIGCAGDNKKEQEHVGKAILQYALAYPVMHLHLLGDLIYPGGVVGRSLAARAAEIKTYLIDKYGDNPTYQVCSGLGNHEEECYGRTGGPLITRAMAKGDLFVKAHQEAERLRKDRNDQAAAATDKYFMPNRYYCQLVFPEGAGADAQPDAIVIHLDSSSLPADKAQQRWLRELNAYLASKYPGCLNRLMMLHHTVDYTVGKRGLKKDERHQQSLGRKPKYPTIAGSYPGNHHQQVGRTLRACGLDLPRWQVTAAHEHTFSVLESCRLAHGDSGLDKDLPAVQLVVGNGGGRDNKKNFKTVAPGLRQTETGYGFAVVRCFSDGSKRVQYYDCPNAKRSASTPCVTALRFEETYDSSGKPSGFKTHIHPKLIESQYEWFEVIFSALSSGNLSVCRLALLTYTDCFNDLDKRRRKNPTGSCVGMEERLSNLLCTQPETEIVAKTSGVNLEQVRVFLNHIEAVLRDYAQGQFTASFNQLCALHYVLNQVYEELKVAGPAAAAHHIATTGVAAAEAKDERPVVVGNDVEEEAGFVGDGAGRAVPARSFTDIVELVKRRLLSTNVDVTAGGINPHHAHETFVAPGEPSDSEDEDDLDDSSDEEDVDRRSITGGVRMRAPVATTSALRRRRRGGSRASSRPDKSVEMGAGLLTSQRRAQQALEDDAELTTDILKVFFQYTAKVGKDRFPELLEYSAEQNRYPNLSSVLLMRAMSRMMDPRVVVASVLAQARDFNLRNMLASYLRARCPSLWNFSENKPSAVLETFIEQHASLTPLFHPSRARRMLGHPRVRNELYRMAITDGVVEGAPSVAAIRVVGVLQRIDRLLNARSSYGYAMSNGMAGWTFCGCRRSRAWMSHADSASAVQAFCDQLREAASLAVFSGQLTVDASKFQVNPSGELIVKRVHRADPLLHQLARLYNVLAEAGADAFAETKEEILGNRWFTAYSPVPADVRVDVLAQ